MLSLSALSAILKESKNILLLLTLVFCSHLLAAQPSSNFFVSLLDSLENTAYPQWVKFDEKSVKSCKPALTNETENLRKLAEAGFGFSSEPIKNEWLNVFCKRKKQTASLIAMSEEYFPLSEKMLKEKGLPDVLKYLPALVSAANPKSGWKNGAGYWHLNLPDAIKAGLRVSPVYDERLLVEKSTKAAATILIEIYLKNNGELKKTVEDFVLGKHHKISKVQVNSNFYSPESLSEAFFAIVYFFEAKPLPDFFSAKMNFPETVEHTLDSNIYINFLNEKYPFDAKAINYLNAGFSSGNFQKNSKIKIPKNEFELFESWMITVKEEKIEDPEKILHRIRSGETLSSIAGKYNVRVNELMEWNNLSSTLIREGQELKIYKAVIK